MRVLLVYPDTDPLSIIPSGLINIEPLGLEYLAGAIPDHEVRILDLKVEKRWQKVIRDFEPDVVGITGTVVHTTRMLAILHYSKSVLPEVFTVVGGPHATLVPQDFAASSVDALIPGQDPLAFGQLVEALDRRGSLEEIPGLQLADGAGFRASTPPAVYDDLDHLPLPRRDLTAAWRHKYRHLVWQPVALMVTSVGCPHGCNFCPCPALTGRRVLKRSPELVRDELVRIAEPYVYIGDDNLFFDYRHATRIADLVEEAGLQKQFYVLSRVDDINRHPDLVKRWARIGLRKVFLGLESPSDQELKALNKRGTVSENSRAVEILHDHGVDPLGAFIIRPEYTRADFDRILEYMDRMRIYYFEFTVLTPFPGTAFYEEVKDTIQSHDTRLFDLAHSLFETRLPIDRFYREFSRLHRRAASPVRALRIRPAVSPFRRLAYFRQGHRLAGLFFAARRAYRLLAALNSSGGTGHASGPTSTHDVQAFAHPPQGS